jgi:tRNA-specific 2-thiouridylase
VKFEKFLHRAVELECDKIATGHYARISKDTRYLLKTGIDTAKDQSYFLYAMTQNQLAKTLFPLGELTKNEVREIAKTQNLVNAKKRDSQDICFAPKGDYAGFITSRTNTEPQEGNFIDRGGKILGRHKGVINYTIGQRKGLGITAAEPLFVTGINAAENTIILGASTELFSKNLKANDINLIPIEKLDGKLRVQAKIRYAHSPHPATIWQTDNSDIHVEFDEPQRAITSGQAVVFYDGEIVIGGGTIM